MKDFNFILFNVKDKDIKYRLVISLRELDISWVNGSKHIQLLPCDYICFCVDGSKKNLAKHRLYITYISNYENQRKNYEILRNNKLTSYLPIPIEDFELFKESFVDGVFDLERFRTMIKPKIIANDLGIF